MPENSTWAPWGPPSAPALNFRDVYNSISRDHVHHQAHGDERQIRRQTQMQGQREENGVPKCPWLFHLVPSWPDSKGRSRNGRVVVIRPRKYMSPRNKKKRRRMQRNRNTARSTLQGPSPVKRALSASQLCLEKSRTHKRSLNWPCWKRKLSVICPPFPHLLFIRVFFFDYVLKVFCRSLIYRHFFGFPSLLFITIFLSCS